MLVLSRKIGQTIHIADDIEVTVLGVQGGRVRLGINAPRQVAISRGELQSESDCQSVSMYPAACSTGNENQRKSA